MLTAACATFGALAVLVAMWSPAAARAQTADPWEGSRFTSPTNDTTTSSGIFAGTFTHRPPAPIASVDLDVVYSATDTHATACGTAPRPQTITYAAPTTTTTTIQPAPTEPSTPTTDAPITSSSVDFSFTPTFVCNGIYDATATAHIDGTADASAGTFKKTISVVAVRVAIPPPPPASLVATDNGNHTVTVTWAPPSSYAKSGPPPDFEGYRVSRKEGAAAAPTVVGQTAPDALTFTDPTVPDGAYVYQVEALRKFAASTPVVTGSPLTVGASGPTATTAGSGSGGRVGGGGGGTPTTADPGSGGTGKMQFDSSSLAGDDTEPGDALAQPPGGAVQRFSDSSGAGLLKPFATALDLGVWAALLLFLTRRAAKAERAHLLAVKLEQPR